MKELIKWHFYYLLFNVYLGHSHGYRFSYTDYYIEDPHLCSQAGLKTGEIKLDNNRSAAKLSNKHQLYNFYCKMKVKTSNKSDGIIAVIQHLMLRRNEVTGECIDYIQFKTKGGFISRDYCGAFNAELKMDEIFNERNSYDVPIAENSYLNGIGNSLEVVISFGRQPLNPYEETNISIVFTLYTPCSKAPRSFKPCVDGGEVCIPQMYFNDHTINCPYVGCIDEGECTLDKMQSEKLSVGNKVLISSISTMVISFLIFILCIYLCRKYKKFCWSEEFSQPQEETTTPRVIELQDHPLASAPPVPQTARDRELEKDLPPSYESLFPDR